jgi:hypothetical protein
MKKPGLFGGDAHLEKKSVARMLEEFLWLL